jgi:hypothetical protein
VVPRGRLLEDYQRLALHTERHLNGEFGGGGVLPHVGTHVGVVSCLGRGVTASHLLGQQTTMA